MLVVSSHLKMMSGYNNILVIGSGAREHAIVRSLERSPHEKKLYCLASNMNPGIAELCDQLTVGNINDPDFVVNYAQEIVAKLAFIGPENPLENGVADALWDAGIKPSALKKSSPNWKHPKHLPETCCRNMRFRGTNIRPLIPWVAWLNSWKDWKKITW